MNRGTRPQSDFGRVAGDYARHRRGFPGSFFARLRERGIGGPCQRVLDLASGTGNLARGFARGGARVWALDRSGELLAEAERLNRAAGVRIPIHRARAEATGLAPASFDVVVAGQCWGWFERPAIHGELARVLAPGGVLVVASLDWLARPGSAAAATEALIREHNPRWSGGGGNGLHAEWVDELEAAGWRGVELFGYEQTLAFSHVRWRGRIRASVGVGIHLPRAAVERFDRALAALLAERFPQQPLAIPHRVFAVIARRPSQPPVEGVLRPSTDC